MNAADEVRDPPAFAPHGMAWYQIDNFVELVHAAQVAYYGNLGLFTQPWRRPPEGRKCYSDTKVGYENWERDAKSLDWRAKAPGETDKEITEISSISDLIEFCKFTISQLLHEIIRFEASVAAQPELVNSISITPVQKFQRYDASKMLLDVYRVCTNILPGERVPVLPERNGAFELQGYLTRVLAESLKRDSSLPTEQEEIREDGPHEPNQVWKGNKLVMTLKPQHFRLFTLMWKNRPTEKRPTGRNVEYTVACEAVAGDINQEVPAGSMDNAASEANKAFNEFGLTFHKRRGLYVW